MTSGFADACSPTRSNPYPHPGQHLRAGGMYPNVMTSEDKDEAERLAELTNASLENIRRGFEAAAEMAHPREDED